MRFSGKRLGLLDAMIAVAAISLVASNLRHRVQWDRRINQTPIPSPRAGWTPTGVAIRVPVALQLGRTPLAIVTATWLLILLRKQGPIGHAASWGPGALACLTATFGLGAGILLTWAETAARTLASRGFSARAWGNPFLSNPWAVIDSGVHAAAAATGFAVAGAWFALRLQGRREGGTHWLDLTGRVIGAGWLIVAFNDLTLVGVANELIRVGR